ncbi:MAG: helix-turn-helix domain-containing protein [Bacteroidales bacterium]|jgi:3-methyladenine DNA glycosylase Tag
MDAIILSSDQYQAILNKIEEINIRIQTAHAAPGESFVDNQQFLQLMQVSKRTAQTWRDEGKISFSQVGAKIYYKLSDIETMLKEHYKKSFQPKRR